MDREALENFMRRLQGGEIDALDGIYALTHKGAYLLAMSILKSSQAAKDVMQDTFVAVAANIGKYRLGSNACAWIYTIARNLSYKEYAFNKRTTSIDAAKEALDQRQTAHEELWTGQIDLDNALKQLDETEREVVTLFSIKGLKHKEIAQILSKPLGTVLWIYHKALKRLKKLLGRG